MKLNILGTGHGTTINCYNTCFTIDDENDEYFLVDAGGGNRILQQLSSAQIPIEKITTMFISHTHTDHILGAMWIIRFWCRKCLKEKIEHNFYIYGNGEVIRALRAMSSIVLPQKFNNLLNNKIIFEEIDTGSTAQILNKKVEFFDIDAKKVKQTGFMMWINENEKFTFIGDETCSESTEKYVKNSKWLFADAFMSGEQAEVYDPIKKHRHSTVKFVAMLCERLNVKNVIMSHTVDTDLANRRKLFTEDAKIYYSGNVFVPDDLDVIEIK